MSNGLEEINEMEVYANNKMMTPNSLNHFKKHSARTVLKRSGKLITGASLDSSAKATPRLALCYRLSWQYRYPYGSVRPAESAFVSQNEAVPGNAPRTTRHCPGCKLALAYP